MKSYGANSSHCEQAILELVRRYGNPTNVVSAFTKELETLILSKPQGFIRYTAFLQKLIHNSNSTATPASLNSQRLHLTRLARSNLAQCPLNARSPRLRYTQKLDALHEYLLASMREPKHRIIDFKPSGTKLPTYEATKFQQPTPNLLTCPGKTTTDIQLSVSTGPTNLTRPIYNQAHYSRKSLHFLKLPVDRRLTGRAGETT